ncbi:MAG TPA: hypothetical protein ENG36_03350 [Lentisphaerae bacterium]|nr:hypothetical protein [Lentisphaerota bacterium]
MSIALIGRFLKLNHAIEGLSQGRKYRLDGLVDAPSRSKRQRRLLFLMERGSGGYVVSPEAYAGAVRQHVAE